MALADIQEIIEEGLQYEENMDLLFDAMPEWRGWDLPFDTECYLCRTGRHELCQASWHFACGCWQQDHEEKF